MFSLLAALLLLLTLTSSTVVGEEEEEDTPHQLVIFAVDGLTGSSSTARWLPFTNSVMSRHGVFTSKARTVTSTQALPGWIANFYASTPAEYGCVDDYTCDAPPEVENAKSLIDVLVDYGYAVDLCSEGKVLAQALKNRYPVKQFRQHTLDMLSYGLDESTLPQTDRRVLLFHFNAPQHVAHAHGYDSDVYHAQTLCVDWQIQQLTHSLWKYWPKRTTFLLISDHGGLGYQHATFDVQSLQVPLGMWGYNVARGVDLFSRAVDTTQMAPTILSVLGYDIPEEWLHPPLRNVASRQGCDSRVLQNATTVVTKFSVCPVPQDFTHQSLRTGRDLLIAIFLVAMSVQAGVGYWVFRSYAKI